MPNININTPQTLSKKTVERFLFYYPKYIKEVKQDERLVAATVEMLKAAPPEMAEQVQAFVDSLNLPKKQPMNIKPAIPTCVDVDPVEAQRQELLDLKEFDMASSVVDEPLASSANHLANRNSLLGKVEPDGVDMATDQKIHAELELLLSQNAQQLAFQANQFQSQLTKDSRVRSQVEDAVQLNAIKLKQARESIAKVSSGTWKTTIMVWLSVFVVLLVFLFTVLYMRLFNSKRHL